MTCISPSPLSLDLPAEPSSVPTARHALGEFVAGHEVDRPAVEVAVSEAVTNAVVHAYGSAMGRVRVSARFEDDALRIEVADDGQGMRPRADSPGLGLGLPLIVQLAAHVDISSENGTTVRMDFRLEAQ
jgi:serine/threonine-protein kinase RsbW/stage II sporulation protein AB (anti-sigma F factor)